MVLSYLMKCAITGDPYVYLGIKANSSRQYSQLGFSKNMFWHFIKIKTKGEVYNAGGGDILIVQWQKQLKCVSKSQENQ